MIPDAEREAHVGRLDKMKQQRRYAKNIVPGPNPVKRVVVVENGVVVDTWACGVGTNIRGFESTNMVGVAEKDLTDMGYKRE